MFELYRPVEKFQGGYDVGQTTAADSTPECYLGSELITKAKIEATIVFLTWVPLCLYLLSTAFTGMGGGVCCFLDFTFVFFEHPRGISAKAARNLLPPAGLG